MTFEIEPRAYTDPDITRLVAEVQAHYVELYGAPDEAAVDVDEFVPPNGIMFVGALDGDVVAMGGWRRTADPAVAEIKRMYVSPRVQRRGLGRIMLAAVERSALEAGVGILVLNTGRPQQPAIALYRGAGYQPGEPFGHYAGSTDAVFLSKQLGVRA